MRFLKLFTCISAIIGLWMVPAAAKETIRVNSQYGIVLIEIDPEAPFNEVLEQIRVVMSEEECEFILDVSEGARPVVVARNRDFNREVLPKEKEDIAYILTTMASSTWTELLAKKSSLKRAGDRVDHLHPFRFLLTIFQDEELRGCAHSIRDRKKIWKEFFDGLCDTLDYEHAHGNVRPEHVQAFASMLQINPGAISPHIEQRRWKEFAEVLLDLLPRTGNYGRYDM